MVVSVAVDILPLMFLVMVALKHPKVMIVLPIAVQGCTPGRKGVPAKFCSYTDSGMASRSAPVSEEQKLLLRMFGWTAMCNGLQLVVGLIRHWVQRRLALGCRRRCFVVST